MDSKKVQILLQVVEAGSMMKIAEDLGYTPSGLVHMMNSLEDNLDVKLIHRGNHGIRLTTEGEKILPLLKEYLELEQKIQNEIHKIKSESHERIRIGAYTSVAKNWIPQIVIGFRRMYSNVNIEIEVMGHPEACEALRSGKVDFIFTCFDPKYHFEFIPLKKDYFFAVLPPDTLLPKSENKKFPVKKFEEYPFIMPSFGIDFEVRRILETHDVHTKLVAAVADDPVVVSMVANGFGASMLSELVLRRNKEQVMTLPIHPAAYRELGLALKSSSKLTPIEQRFISYVKTVELM